MVSSLTLYNEKLDLMRHFVSSYCNIQLNVQFLKVKKSFIIYSENHQLTFPECFILFEMIFFKFNFMLLNCYHDGVLYLREWHCTFYLQILTSPCGKATCDELLYHHVTFSLTSVPLLWLSCQYIMKLIKENILVLWYINTISVNEIYIMQ